MDPFRLKRIFFLHINSLSAHLLEATKIPYGDALTVKERRPFALTWEDGSHVVQGRLSDGILQGHHLQHGPVDVLFPGFLDHVGAFSLASPAYPAVADGIGFAAQRTIGDSPPALLLQKGGLHLNGLDPQNFRAGLFDFRQQTILILFRFCFQFEKPRS